MNEDQITETEPTTPATSTAPLTVTVVERERASRWTGAFAAAAVFAFAGLAYQAYLSATYEERIEGLRDNVAHLTEVVAVEADRVVLLQDQLKVERDARQKDEDELRALTPPTNDKLFSILSQGVGVTEDVVRTTNVGTTPDAAFVTDLTSGQRTDAFTQEVLIKNTHASQTLCVTPIAWSAGGGATCALKCAAATATCSGASTDGFHIEAGTTLSRRYDGTSCVCVEGSAAGTTYQSERVLR